jgi:hypothetical protein
MYSAIRFGSMHGLGLTAPTPWALGLIIDPPKSIVLVLSGRLQQGQSQGDAL